MTRSKVTCSIASNSPVIQIEPLKTKFDLTVVSNSLIALLEHNYDEARFLQQLHYWSYSQYGVVIDGMRWIYKSIKEWLSEALVGLTEWKLRKAIKSLLEKKLIRREQWFARHQKQEYNSFWWQPKNRTYYYSINYDELEKLIEKVQSHENGRIESSTELSVEKNQQTKVCELSQNRSKTTTKKETTNSKSDPSFEPKLQNSVAVAAAPPKKASQKPKDTKQPSTPQSKSNSQTAQSKPQPAPNKPDPKPEKQVPKVDYIINKAINPKWRSQIPLLDSVGISINKTIEDLLKMYPADKIESAVAVVKARKREQHIPNLGGYFVAALKGDWASSTIVNSENYQNDRELNSAAVFRHWYDLARELGYCSGQEVRDGEQWICLSGVWERWTNAVERGYTLDYLKKIMKRNQN